MGHTSTIRTIAYRSSIQESTFQQGDRVFVYMPVAKRGKAYKFTKLFSGPYRIVELFNNGAAVQLISRPHSGTVRVALNRIRRCPKEIPDTPEPEGTAEPEATESQEEPSATVQEEATSTDRREALGQKFQGPGRTAFNPDIGQARTLTRRAEKCNILALNC